MINIKSKNPHPLVTLSIGLGCSLFAIIISFLFSGLITAWENKTLDYRFKLRGSIPSHPDIVLIDIDDVSMRAIGRWPWGRSYHARMIDILTKSGVSAIGYDVLFDQPADVEGDTILKNITAGAKNLYYPVGFALQPASIEPEKHTKSVPSMEMLKEFNLPQPMPVNGHILKVERSVAPFIELLRVSEGMGHISSNRDTDGTVRRVPLAVNLEGGIFPAFGLSVARAYLQVPEADILIQPGSGIILKNAERPGETGPKDIKIPIDDHGMMVINYAGRWEETFVHYSFIDILKTAENEKERNDLREGLKGKICIVSNTATGYDLKPTSVEENYPGGGIHASIINTILTEDFLRETSPTGRILMLIILAIGAAWLSAGSVVGRDWKMSLFSLFVLIAAYWGLSYAAFLKLGLITEVFSPSLGMIVSYLTATLYGKSVEQKHSVRISGEMEHLGKSLKSMSQELSEKEGELFNLREELSERMSTFNTVMVRDEESIQRIALLEARVESVLKEKDILLESKQQLEMKLAHILSEPVHSEYPLEGEWEDIQKECAVYGIITRSMKVLKIFEQVKKAAQTRSSILI
ncbi:MAG: CHASE2 domain-containing protein [Nitrospirae bacterium]|nr:CHASE2 domain-containing protein [Nitrospirota bacterium]